MSPRALTSLLLIAAAHATAQTDDAALLRCAGTAGDAARLACYDALAVQARQRAASPGSAAATAQAAQVEAFGRPRIDASDLDLVESRIPGRFEGWRAGTRITLANGQVWQVSDDSQAWADLRDPVVRVRRAALGSYRLEVEGLTRSPRVRRVQ